MLSVRSKLLGTVVALSMGAACVNGDSLDNDKTTGQPSSMSSDDAGASKPSTTTTTPKKDAGTAPTTGGNTKPTTGGGTMTGGDTTPPTDGTGTVTADGGTSPVTPSGTGSDAGGSSVGMMSEGDAGMMPTDPGTDPTQMMPPEPMMSVVNGTADGCSSYATPKGGMCGGYYCHVSQDQIQAEVPNPSACGDAAGACDNSLVLKVGGCARDALTTWVITHFGQDLTDAEAAKLRPDVQTCVYKDANIKAKASEACLSCFLDAAQCAGVHCQNDCAMGDSSNCDKCRLKNNCDQPVADCAGMPNPF